MRCLVLCVALLAAGPSARAAEPTIKECLDAYEASLAFKNENKLEEALSRLEVCSSASCPTDVRIECVRRTGDLEAALAAQRAAAPPPAPTPPPTIAPPPPVSTTIATTPPAATGPPARPLYARWWFWTAAAAVVAGGVTTALILSRPETSQPSSRFPVMTADLK